MLVGKADPVDFEKGAPELKAFDAAAVTFPGSVFVQALFEVRFEAMCEMLPPALHPTMPPLAGISIFDVPESEWGAFRMAQLRIQCRSGLRPRALLVGAVVDSEPVGRALAERFGFRVRAGEVTLTRAYDVTRVEVSFDGDVRLRTSMRGPIRIGDGDTQFVSSMHPARTPRGFRLVQVDTRHIVHRAERAPLVIDVFDAAAWGEPRLEPTRTLPGVVGLADVTLDAIRFVCRADVMAFEGSEPADSEA